VDDRKRRFFRIRLAVLSTILVGVLLYAWRDWRSRHLRSDWRRTLRIAVVLVPSESLDEGAVTALKARTRDLENQLAHEMARYGREIRPFSFFIATVPNGLAAPTPVAPSDPSDLLAVLEYNWALAKWSDRVDDEAGVADEPRDATLYLVAHDGARAGMLSVEGTGQQGGRIGVVEIDLDESMVDIALFVVAHELFHILGASDKYAPGGAILVPEGLADPAQDPLYPQRRAELMARHRAISQDDSVLPETIEELAVGPATAREVGWLVAP
jgi:hypothetical protein